MTSIYDIKPAFQNLLRPFLHRLARYGVTPNQITLSAIILSLLGGVIVWYSTSQPVLLLVIPVLLLLRMALNALDGMLAREYAQASPLGEILNEVGDIVSDVALYLPLISWFSTIQTVFLIALFLVSACLTEFCGILSKAMTGTRRYDGPMGKSDRAFFISLFACALYFWPALIQQASTAIFLILDALLVISCLNRLRYILIAQKGIIQ